MKTPPPFTAYYISGIWTDYKNQVSHYSVHRFLNPGVSGGKKVSIEEVIDLMGKTTRPFYVFGWDYKSGQFRQGEQIFVFDGYHGKMLWTAKKEERTKNLTHLIKLNWFSSL